MLLISCWGDYSSSNITKGRTIAIETFAPVVRDRITFTDTEGNIRLIKPKQDNKIVAVKVRIINDSVTYVPLFIDTEAAELGDRGGARGWNIDPYKNSVSSSSKEAELDKFTPLLSGHIELNKGFEDAIKDQDFLDEYAYYCKHYIGRPSPLYYAENLTKNLKI